MKFDRRSQIKELLESDGIVYLSKLSKLFPDVSLMTLRRDLDFFEQEGLAVRIYGGAQKKTAGSEPFYGLRANKNRDKKERIARLCVPYISEGRSVFIDCGTTAMELAKAVPDIPLFVLTPGPNIAMELARRQSIKIMLLGGQLNRDNMSISGNLAIDMLEKVNIDIAFVASSGYSSGGAFSCGSQAECEVKQKVLGKAREKIVMMDDTKYGKTLMFTFAKEPDIDVFVSNSRPPDELYGRLAAEGKKVVFLK